MKNQKVLGALCASALGALGVLFEAEAMKLSHRERFSREFPRGVFLFRGEPTAVSLQLRIDGFGDTSRSSCPQRIVIPWSIEVLGEDYFKGCPLTYIAFEFGSQLWEVGARAFSDSSLRSICIPASVERLMGHCFEKCRFLASVTFEQNPQLTRVEEYA
ncbi:MAG: leucine-rich repeat domain-containing protein, partial [Holosporales bacterium]|nr:leucine-rich repeat domain-containing protein [Holosporales bacterium]